MFKANAFRSFGNFPCWDALHCARLWWKGTDYNIFIGQCDLYLHRYSIFVDYAKVISAVWVNSKILFILFCRSNCVDLLMSGWG